ncbi:hypothetical protein CLOM_g9599 [Closterium sp. NIES-68]|nr:hypothetical protein CLOM_g9599 [Closterium sp. NIES-68]
MQQQRQLDGSADISMTSASTGSSLEQLTVQQLIDVYQQLCSEFPIVSIEDPFDQEDFDATQALCEAGFTQVVGNDLLVSNAKRLAQAIERRTCNGIAIKLPLIGTLSEALEVAKAARAAGWTVVAAGGLGQQGTRRIVCLLTWQWAWGLSESRQGEFVEANDAPSITSFYGLRKSLETRPLMQQHYQM